MAEIKAFRDKRLKFRSLATATDAPTSSDAPSGQGNVLCSIFGAKNKPDKQINPKAMIQAVLGETPIIRTDDLKYDVSAYSGPTNHVRATLSDLIEIVSLKNHTHVYPQGVGSSEEEAIQKLFNRLTVQLSAHEVIRCWDETKNISKDFTWDLENKKLTLVMPAHIAAFKSAKPGQANTLA